MPTIAVLMLYCLACFAKGVEQEEYRAVKQTAWTTYESEKTQAGAAYEAERDRIWAEYNVERKICPDMHKLRRTAVFMNVMAALHGAVLTVTHLGRAISSDAKEKHCIKRADRSGCTCACA